VPQTAGNDSVRVLFGLLGELEACGFGQHEQRKPDPAEGGNERTWTHGLGFSVPAILYSARPVLRQSSGGSA
jgi:hypothetical protein